MSLLKKFLILFIDTTINQGNEHTLSPCRKDPVIYKTNRPVEQNKLINL